jgi:4-alpha-glucanotransferase
MYDYERLVHLAELYGVERQYYDIWGNLHAAPEDTLIAILRAMSVTFGSAEELEREIDAAEHGPWLRPLEPVYVFREGAEIDVRVNIAARFSQDAVRWRFTHDDGRDDLGSVTPSACREAGRSSVHGEDYLGFQLQLPVKPGIGYHGLSLEGAMQGQASIIVVPGHCHTPDALKDGGRLWGITLQLYSLRSKTNWGMGDFTDLAKFIDTWAGLGADIVGINPLHSLFVHRPDEYSPYYPSSRRSVNAMYIDPCAVDDFAECEEAKRLYGSEPFRERLKRARETEFVDGELVYQLKLEMLDILYKSFREKHLSRGTKRAEEFLKFVSEGGETLRLNSLYEALMEKLVRPDRSVGGWLNWPQEYRNPETGEVAAFEKENAERTGFYSYLQWQAGVQLDRVGQLSIERGLKVGIYQDLAVGCSANGSEVWTDRRLYGRGISVGAPPDGFNLRGQSWGLPPLVPTRLREEAYVPFIETLRCNMRDAGAIRLDHILGLMRLFWVPAGREPVEGAYVRYPFEDLMGIVALESVRNRCLVIGEDLGTVPPEVPELMQAMDMLSFRVFYWEMDHTGEYRPPPEFTRNALVTVGTHDLPTLAGYWQGADIVLRDELGLFPSPEVRDAQAAERRETKAKMLRALARQGLAPGGIDPDNPDTAKDMTTELSSAIHRYIARSASKVMVVQLEDAAGSKAQMNMPGTNGELPNWRRRLDVPVEEMDSDSRMRAIAEAVRAERG